MDDASLLAAFQDTSLPAEAFHHREHVRVAWMYVMRYGVAAALTSYGEGLRRFAAAKGKPQLYHETITWAYLLLIGERVARAAPRRGRSSPRQNLICWRGSRRCSILLHDRATVVRPRAREVCDAGRVKAAEDAAGH